MIFVDSNIFIYAVGRPHPLKEGAQNFFIESSQKGMRLVTSAEVLKELLHAYLSVARLSTLDAAMTLAVKGVDQIFPIDSAVVLHAHNLVNQYPGLAARDLVHLAVCHQHQIKELKTFDRNLHSAFEKKGR